MSSLEKGYSAALREAVFEGRRKNARLKGALRSMFANMPELGLVKPPNFHKDGVSFIVPVKDEAQWIGAALTSIEEVADEVIVVDSSVEDSTTEIVAAMAQCNRKIKHIRFYCQGPHSLALSCHIGLVNAKYRWAFKWEGDMVAKSTEALYELKGRLNGLSRSSYYVIDLPRINLEGDLRHQSRDWLTGSDMRIFTWSPELRWVLKSNCCDQLIGDSIWGERFPPWYKTLYWKEFYIFHCNIKSPNRMLERIFWNDYMKNRDTTLTLAAYTERRVREDWNMTVEEAEKMITDKILKELVPYDENRFGELPKVLRG
jgi:glycosyltransferase involved in cell wall biosynthesis